jgi:hypothetical protein
MSPWFHKLSRFQQRISNAAKAIQSPAAAGNADRKALHRAWRSMHRATHDDVIFGLPATALLFEQNLLYMVFQANFSLLVVVRSGSLR